LTDDERAASVERGFRAASLGPTTLRFETAAVAALAIAVQRVLRAG
jgi:16S rRNA U1498 N3-methylase RsmE